MILGVLQQKGGVGKTTLSINIAACFARKGLRTLLVDADPQGSALAWSSVREEPPLFPVVGMAKPTLHKDLPELAAGYDIVIIDGAPRVNELARSAILASNLVLIPTQPSPFDVWACDETVAIIREAQQFHETLKAAFVINRKVANTVIGRDVAEAVAELPFPLLKRVIHQRIIFAESAASGLSVFDIAPDGDAAREITSLADLLISEQQQIRKAA